MTFKNVVYGLLTLLAGFIIFNACQSPEELDKARFYVNGKTLYEAHCQNCHGGQGEGLGKLYPPLSDTTSLKENHHQLACFIKNGLSGIRQIGGKTFDTEMPANPRLSDVEIAYLITYISNSFGNNLGIKRDSTVRKELMQCQHKKLSLAVYD
ncbi:Cytochrome c, mono-and diheme variants [bacterium A37T11]|nr:Cytochrome c, mono-and diheme variants [bacterium A37T11]